MCLHFSRNVQQISPPKVRLQKWMICDPQKPSKCCETSLKSGIHLCIQTVYIWNRKYTEATMVKVTGCRLCKHCGCMLNTEYTYIMSCNSVRLMCLPRITINGKHMVRVANCGANRDYTAGIVSSPLTDPQ